jgi:hypothetical protein
MAFGKLLAYNRILVSRIGEGQTILGVTHSH